VTDLYRLRGIQVRYDTRLAQAVDVPEFSVTRGEILALIGPSGAGKSTLLRLLGFGQPQTAGEIEYRGTKYGVGHMPEIAVCRSIASVYQRSLPLGRTVFENVAFGLRMRREANITRRVPPALREVGLDTLARAHARTLSGGELQRMALARALVLNTDVLLLDEPTANLDPANTRIIERCISQANAARNATIVLVTHNIFQARRLAHRTALMLDGRIVEAGPTESLFASPAESRTAAFLRGDMIW
jgi:tungstate transport system ATP-binding protein